SGEHMHFGMGIVTRGGEKVNLFSPGQADSFMSRMGYGALMGLLKHWPLVNPFITHSLDALNRLKPGFEAPVSVVASLGQSPDAPSRNRTVLVGLIRSDNPLSTRFELRAPNPHTNTYLAAAAVYLVMLDGMKYAVSKKREELHGELTKKYGEPSAYLEQYREYVSEENIFSSLTPEERERLYGKPPETVWEILEAFRGADRSPLEQTPFREEIINSALEASLNKWIVEIREKFLPGARQALSSCQRRPEREEHRDTRLWKDFNGKRRIMLKDRRSVPSMASEIELLLDRKEYGNAGRLMANFMALYEEAEKIYSLYVRNTMI
ncbi:MAG TPA: glutamine synthetase, partial [Firmicutes bacterium]|nr:glutamine synthetase [Bacillota bacterium]